MLIVIKVVVEENSITFEIHTSFSTASAKRRYFVHNKLEGMAGVFQDMPQLTGVNDKSWETESVTTFTNGLQH